MHMCFQSRKSEGKDCLKVSEDVERFYGSRNCRVRKYELDSIDNRRVLANILTV
jgi:hypothetical protein